MTLYSENLVGAVGGVSTRKGDVADIASPIMGRDKEVSIQIVEKTIYRFLNDCSAIEWHVSIDRSVLFMTFEDAGF